MFLAVLSIIFMMGCIPYADHPLTAPDREKIDAAILGTWFWKEKDEAGYIHMGLNEQSGLLRVVMAELKTNGVVEISELGGHTSFVKENTYLNLKWVSPAESKFDGYMIVKYKATPDALGIGLMDNEVVEKAIEAGELNGNVKKGKWFSTIRITENPKKFQEFVLKSDKELFPEMKFLKKLNLPAGN